VGRFFLEYIAMASRNIIGKRLRIARTRATPPITQAELAARLQVQSLPIERVTISKIETGYREVTDVEVAAIARILGVSVGWLFGENEKAGNSR
jgi:HTH-type transcriptional regulator, cell division transcriptional repressor